MDPEFALSQVRTLDRELRDLRSETDRIRRKRRRLMARFNQFCRALEEMGVEIVLEPARGAIGKSNAITESQGGQSDHPSNHTP